MGGEIGQWRERNHDGAVDWYLLDDADCRGLQTLVRDLNNIYKCEPALWEVDTELGGFQ
jgi:1,4-alpha-glucan branching enzyme